MLKAYIIKSRVRDGEKLLLAQLYAPHLFKQGTLLGPQLLQDVLLKKITVQQAKKNGKGMSSRKKENENRLLATRANTALLLLH
eukprot:277521-Karenia_brevis.AAC.1